MVTTPSVDNPAEIHVAHVVDPPGIRIAISGRRRRCARWPRIGAQLFLNTASATIVTVLCLLASHDGWADTQTWSDQALLLLVGALAPWPIVWAQKQLYARRHLDGLIHAGSDAIIFAEQKPGTRSAPDFRPVARIADIIHLHVLPIIAAPDLHDLVVEKRDGSCATIPLVADHAASLTAAHELAAHLNSLPTHVRRPIPVVDMMGDPDTSEEDLEARGIMVTDDHTRQFNLAAPVPPSLALLTVLLATGLAAAAGSHLALDLLRIIGMGGLIAILTTLGLWRFTRATHVTLTHHTVQVLDRCLFGYRRHTWFHREVRDVRTILKHDQRTASLCFTTHHTTTLGATRRVGDLMRVCSALRDALGLK